MAKFLLHSLIEFWPLIEKILDTAAIDAVVEVGTEANRTTKKLCDWAQKGAGRQVHAIDPAPVKAADELVGKFPQLKFHKDYSLKVLPQLIDLPANTLYLIDGDHNYYTVSNELKIIAGQDRSQSRPVILHDVGWPCARRDLYYKNGYVPQEQMHPHSFEVGMILGKSKAELATGFRGEGAWAAALEEGGPKNGVLTAVEDFLKENPDYQYFQIDAIFGLGILLPPKVQHLGLLKAFLQPFADNFLLAKLEKNRLELYLEVIRLQDELSNRQS